MTTAELERLVRDCDPATFRALQEFVEERARRDEWIPRPTFKLPIPMAV